MADVFEDHKATFSIGDRIILNLCFADDIDVLAGREIELANLMECLDKTSTVYSMQISAEKAKLSTNISIGIGSKIMISGHKLKRLKFQISWSHSR